MDINSIPAFAQIIANYGFPALITFYLLVRLEKRLENINNATEELVKTIKELKNP
ncbi:YvrJ family protein (plasmid) [Bacillus velezensis]|uniref:YvrJ family protein n=1 Tax=Bacillus velezensis TaxID=492670 RepID=UPI0038D3FBB7